MSSKDARDNQIARCHSNFWLSLCTERTICTVRTLVQLRNASPASSKRRCETTNERESRGVRPSLGNRDYYFMRLWRCRHRYDLSHVLKYCTTVKYRLDREVSKKRIAWTGQGIERSKWTALRLTMQRTGRAYMGLLGRLHLMSRGSVRRRHLPRDNHHLPSLVSKSSCDCDDADIDKTYRMCYNITTSRL